MRKFLTAPNLRQTHPARYRSLARPLLAVAAALACTSLAAAEIGDHVQANATSAEAAEIPWISGGISLEARDEMLRNAADYNVLVVFSERDGSYLADIPFTVAGSDGRQLLSGVSEGPLLYLRLPAASYRISAEIDGAWQGRQIRAGTGGQPARTNFVSGQNQ